MKLNDLNTVWSLGLISMHIVMIYKQGVKTQQKIKMNYIVINVPCWVILSSRHWQMLSVFYHAICILICELFLLNRPATLLLLAFCSSWYCYDMYHVSLLYVFYIQPWGCNTIKTRLWSPTSPQLGVRFFFRSRTCSHVHANERFHVDWHHKNHLPWISYVHNTV